MIEVRDEGFAAGLLDLAEVINRYLGGGYDYSTGVDFQNDVFEMWGYWRHSECEVCDEAGWKAGERVLLDHGWTKEEVNKSWTTDKAYPENYNELYDAELERIRTPHDCPLQEWGFTHYASGLKVKWYKRIGRSPGSNLSLSVADWHRTVAECIESVGEPS